MRQEILTHTYDLSRRSFAHNTKAPIRKKKELRYYKKQKVFYRELAQGSCP